MKLIIDAMGGDNAPSEIVKGTIETLNERKDFSVIFCGQEDKIQAELSKYTFDRDKVEIVNATEIISMEEHPVDAIRKKKDSSMQRTNRLQIPSIFPTALPLSPTQGQHFSATAQPIAAFYRREAPHHCPGLP